MHTRERARPLYAHRPPNAKENGVTVARPAPYPIAPLQPGETTDFARTAMRVFGHSLDDATIAHLIEMELAEPSLSLAARDDGRIVGTTTVLEFRMTLPGARAVDCAGVTTVTVLPTHRRRGILTSLMRRQLDDLYAEGRTWAALYASESTIYGRFGYGPATRSVTGRIDRPWTTMHMPVTPGDVELLTPDGALERVPPIYGTVAGEVPGMMVLPDVMWRDLLTWDPTSARDGASERFIVAIGDRAYATYRISGGWDDLGPDATLQVDQCMATDVEAHRQLWAFLFGIDLVQHVRIRRLPVDTPLPWWLAEDRRLRRTLADPLHVRLIDVGAALSQRATTGDTCVVLDVADPFCPWNTRRWALEGDGTRLRCTPSDASADLGLGVRDLASLSLGGHAPDELGQAGLIDEHTPGAVQRLRALLASDRVPYNAFTF
jgi:predicted acetyltransferase